MNTPPVPHWPSRTGLLQWGVALGVFVVGWTAPVRPWGWQGGASMGLALFLAMLAFRTTPGLPPLRSAGAVLATSMMLILLVRVVLPFLLRLLGG